MNFRELEYKYNATNITPASFINFVLENYTVDDMVTARGTDQFFSGGAGGSFVRYRTGEGHNDSCELTIKKKTSTTNSWDRVEVDLPLNKAKCDQETVLNFLELLGHKYEFSLVKHNYIIYTPALVFAYYIVNDKDSYIEIEARKGTFTNPLEAFTTLNLAEKGLGALGITHHNRTLRSLYEMYRG